MKQASLPGSPTGQVVATTHNGRYIGYSVRETAGSAAAIRIWSGGAVGATPATLLDEVALTANASASVSAPNIETQTQFVGGIFVELVSGTMPDGIVRYV